MHLQKKRLRSGSASLATLAILLLMISMLALTAGCGGGGGGSSSGGGGGQTSTTTITGTLEDTTTKTTLKGYVVTVQGTSLTGTTDNSGVFTIASVPLANETLVVTDACKNAIGTKTVDVATATTTTNGRSVGILTFDLTTNPPPPCF